MISVIGYGSLLSEASARETVPGLQNFRIVNVPGYRRIFNKVGVVFLSRHGADPLSLEIASCATAADSESHILCSQFECSEQEYQALLEREHRFEWVKVASLDLAGKASHGLMCTQSSDSHYRQHKCRNDAEYQQRVGQYYQGLLWRDDILPFPRYLAFCLQAAAGQGDAVLNNFLDHSYLADGCTTLRTYLEHNPQLRHWRQIECGYSYQKSSN